MAAAHPGGPFQLPLPAGLSAEDRKLGCARGVVLSSWGRAGGIMKEVSEVAFCIVGKKKKKAIPFVHRVSAVSLGSGPRHTFLQAIVYPGVLEGRRRAGGRGGDPGSASLVLS